MKRFLRIAILVLLTATLLAAMERIRERFLTPPHDLRQFDPAVLGKLDTGMWRSYYERRPLLLFSQLISLLRTQYAMPPIEATMAAYHAAHAAFVFKDGKSRADYEKALPDLEAYYRSIVGTSTNPFDWHRAAALELEWWIQHRDRSPDLQRGLAELQAAIYKLPAERFADHARLRAEAMVLRDDRSTAITDEDWRKIGALLDESWRGLHAAIMDPSAPPGSPSAGR